MSSLHPAGFWRILILNSRSENRAKPYSRHNNTKFQAQAQLDTNPHRAKLNIGRSTNGAPANVGLGGDGGVRVRKIILVFSSKELRL